MIEIADRMNLYRMNWAWLFLYSPLQEVEYSKQFIYIQDSVYKFDV